MQKYLFLLLVVVCHPVFAQTAVDLEVKAIEKQSQKFSRMMVDGNYDALLDIYTDDAKIFPGNRPILENDDLRSYWIPAEDSDHKVLKHQAIAQEIKVWGDEAYDWGYYEGTSVSGGKESTWKGKYVIIWRKVAGEWKMYLDIWNRVPFE